MMLLINILNCSSEFERACRYTSEKIVVRFPMQSHACFLNGRHNKVIVDSSVFFSGPYSVLFTINSKILVIIRVGRKNTHLFQLNQKVNRINGLLTKIVLLDRLDVLIGLLGYWVIGLGYVSGMDPA